MCRGGTFGELAAHPRVASVDSMAWDVRARRLAFEGGFSNSMAHRAEVMRAWYERQVAAVEAAAPAPMMLPLPRQDAAVSEADQEWIDLVEAGEIDAASAAIHMMRGGC